MENTKDMLTGFLGLAFTLICGVVGCLNLPPAFNNWWRLGIFFGLLACYAVGFNDGKNRNSKDAKAERDSMREQCKAAVDAEREQCTNQILQLKLDHTKELDEKNAEITRLSTALEIERLRTRSDVAEQVIEAMSPLMPQPLTEEQLKSIIDTAVGNLVQEDDGRLSFGDVEFGTAGTDAIDAMFAE